MPPSSASHYEGPSPDAFALMVMQRALERLPADASADTRSRLQNRRLLLAQRLIGADMAPARQVAALRPITPRIPVGEATETTYDAFLSYQLAA